MTAFNRRHCVWGAGLSLLFAVLFNILGLAGGIMPLSVIGAIASIAFGLCVMGWIFLYLRELDERLKAIEGKD